MSFSLVKHNNNSISAITTAGSITTGKMVLLQTQTASSSSSVNFTSNIDSTYPIYLFKFINIHPANNSTLRMNGSIDGGSNYNVSKTGTAVEIYNEINDASRGAQYRSDVDIHGTGDFTISTTIGNQNDESGSGHMYLFKPSDTTFVTHFLSRVQGHHGSDYSIEFSNGGFFNTNSAINAIKFVMSSGNIDSGTIKLYGIKDS